MAQLFTNDARSKLTGPITSTSLSLLIDPTDQARFPVATGANWFKIKLEDASGKIEYVRVQRASGSSTLTVASTGERGYEEPTKFPAESWSAGATVELIATAADLQASLAHPSVSTDAHDASAISFTPAGSIAATEVQAAIEELDGNFASYLRNTVGSWINDAGGAARLFFTNVGATIIKGFGSVPFSVQNAASGTVFLVSDTGVAASGADAAASGDLPRLGQVQTLVDSVWYTGDTKDTFQQADHGKWLLVTTAIRTIGSATSGATARANADTSALFTLLWGALANTDLPIQDNTGAASTRGASAAADFAANKRLPLPSFAGLTKIGYHGGDGTFTTDTTSRLGQYSADAVGPHHHETTMSAGPGGVNYAGNYASGLASVAGSVLQIGGNNVGAGTENTVRRRSLNIFIHL